MAKAREKSFVDRVWNVFTSVKLAIVVFSLIALTSIVGTVIEQQAAPERNIQVISKIFGDSAAPSLYRVFDSLGFMDMYHSWWFVTLLMLFSANLLICSIDRFPAIWKAAKAPMNPIKDEHTRTVAIRREFTLKGKPDKVREAVRKAVKSAGFTASEEHEPGLYQFYSQKGNYSRMGVFITHISMLIIFVGALSGIFLGFKGYMNLPEGSTDGVVITQRRALTPDETLEQRVILNALTRARSDVSLAASMLGVEEVHLRARMQRLGLTLLEFAVRCEDFDVSFYGRSDMPKEYSSVLTVLDGGREILTKRIEVNDPLKYKGVTFYQSSYGPLTDSADFVFVLRAVSRTGSSETVRLQAGQSFRIPETGVEAIIEDYSPALAFDQGGRAFTYTDMMNNPAVRLDISDGENTYSKWVLKRYPFTWRLQDGNTIELVDIWRSQFTGLQVRRDPGVWIVYLGCTFMAVGLYIAFFMSHRKIWVRLTEEKGHTRVFVGGYANKNKEGFERKIDKMASLLQAGGK